MNSKKDRVGVWLRLLQFIAICNKIALGGFALYSDDSDTPLGSGEQSDDDAVNRDWVSVVESAIETLATGLEEANPELIEELEAALGAFRRSPN